MADSNTKFTKGVTIKEAGTLIPSEIEIIPGGTAQTKTTVQGTQTVDVVVHLPDATTVLVGRDTTDTLTNKTIDADNNTISNLENDNIKSGAAIDATKIADGSVSNTEFQYLGGVTSDVQTQLNDNNTLITDHIADAVDAHDASSISNVPSGNLVATDVQGALNELQSDIDLRALASDLDDHLIDTVGAHAASAISNTPSGNLAATDVQGALDEIQTELSDHIDDTAAHGTTGNVVGTSDTQNLSNKTFTNKTIFNAEIVGASENISTTGANATIATPAVLVNNLTGALTGLSGVTAPTGVQPLILVNKTGSSLSVLNEDSFATAANRILTGTGVGLELKEDASLWLIYDPGSSRWRVVGGSGSGGGSRFIDDYLALANDDIIFISGTSTDQIIYVQGASGPVTISATAPFSITSGTIEDGTRVTLVGMSNTNSVTILAYTAAAIIGYDVTLGRGNTVTYQYVSSESRWVILSTSN